MSSQINKVVAFAGGAVWALLSGAPAVADDTELFVGLQNASNEAQPNILLVLDDSLSMAAELVTQNSYDPSQAYSAGGCDANHVYWSTTGQPPACDVDDYFDRSGLKCEAALNAFAAAGGGTYRDVLASYDSGTQQRWEQLDPTDHGREVECAEDWGAHGDEPTSNAVYPLNADPSNLWTAGTSDRVQWGQNPTDETYSLYDGNWLAWHYSPGTPSTRMQVIKDVASNLVDDGQRRQRRHAALLAEHGQLHARRTCGLRGRGHRHGPRGHAHGHRRPDGLEIHAAVGDAVRGGALYARPKRRFRAPVAGKRGRLAPGGPVAVQLADPILVPEELHRVFDRRRAARRLGRGRQDCRVDRRRRNVDHGSRHHDRREQQSVRRGNLPAAVVAGGRRVPRRLAEFLHDGDLSPLPGVQNVVTHTVGFALNGNDLPILRETADRGGGNYYEATDTASLTTALSDIVTEILDEKCRSRRPLCRSTASTARAT